jgi:hypothetical protein
MSSGFLVQIGFVLFSSSSSVYFSCKKCTTVCHYGESEYWNILFLQEYQKGFENATKIDQYDISNDFTFLETGNCKKSKKKNLLT